MLCEDKYVKVNLYISVSCGVDNGKCEQICLQQSPTVHHCRCGLGYHLSDDGISCTAGMFSRALRQYK